MAKTKTTTTTVHGKTGGTPKAILVTFFSTFISLFITFLILVFNNNSVNIISIGTSNINLWILVLIYLLVTRHHLRIIFLDIVYIKVIEKNFERIIVWFLFFIAIMGSITFIVSGFGIKALSIFMMVYTFSFLALGILMLAGRLTNPKEQNNLNSILSVFLDVVCLFSWFIIFFTEETNGYFILCLVIGIMIVSEFLRIFKKPFNKRIRDFKIEIKNI